MAAAQANGPPAVLVVDDDDLVRGLMVTVLRRDGYTLHEASNAPKALEVLSAHEIAVVLCDRRMPVYDGDWLVEQLRAKFPATAVILVTGDDSVPTRIALRDGVVGYLLKPMRREAVQDAVRDAVVWHQAASRA